jgi:aryl-alcohol dehydrogenase-like predicted oxidoreductase
VKEADGIKSVHAAIENGINLIDVSPYYGDLKAEIVLGKALKDIPRKEYYLSTKVGRYWINEEKSWDYSAGRVTKSVDESLQRLNIDYIDFIHCHDIEFSDKKQIINETLPALHDIKKIGKVRHVGITGLPLENFKYIINRVDDGTIETIITFCHYSLNDDALVDYFEYLEAHKIGIINAAPLSMGLLTERGVPEWHPAEKEVIETCRKAIDHCISKNEKIEQLAVKYSVNNPRVPTTLVSTSNPENIIQNIKWAEGPLNEKLLHEVLDILKPIHRITWENS